MGRGPANPTVYRDLADAYLKQIGHDGRYKPVLWYWRDRWYRWEDGKWRACSEASVFSDLHIWMMDTDKPSDPDVAKKVLGCVRSRTTTTDAPNLPCWMPRTGNAGHWLHMRNWTVCPELLAQGDDRGKVAKTSRWFSTFSLPYDYEPDAPTPLWTEFLHRQIPDEASRNLLQEFFGYLLTPSTARHAALFLHGEAGTGKSTVMEMAKRMLTEEACSFLPVEEFASAFGISETNGKYLNVVDELSSGGSRISTRAEEALKWYLSGQTITTNRKHLGYLSLTPTARLMVGINRWPDFRDSTDGIWRRIHVVCMERQVGYEQRDSTYWQRMGREASGIFAWAIGGLKRLTQTGRFTVPELSLRAIGSARGSQQSHKAFVEQYVRADASCWVSNKTLMGTYKSWCAANGFKPTYELVDVAAEINRKAPASYPKQCRETTGSSPVRGIQGIRLQATEEQKQ